MLTFEMDDKDKLAIDEVIKMGSYDIMQDDREFKVFVDGKLFYHDEYFSPLEFCQYAIKWLARDKGWLKRKKIDFAYDTIETEENPHIAFRIIEGGWRLESVWQKFECQRIFTDEEVKNFINDVIAQVLT